MSVDHITGIKSFSKVCFDEAIREYLKKATITIQNLKRLVGEHEEVVDNNRNITKYWVLQ